MRLPARQTKLAIVILLAFNLWFYLNYIAPVEKRVRRSSLQSQTTLGDLYSPWRGTQELLLNHRDPYSPEVTRQIQLSYYGRVLRDIPGEQKDQQRFAYPVYVAALLAPSVRLDFATVRTIFYWLLLGITIASVPLWLKLVGRPPGRLSLITFVAVVASSVPVIQGLNLQQLGLLVAGLLAAAAAALARRQFLVAGVLLGFASIKPQMMVLISGWVLLWICADWQERKAIFWGMAGTLTALVVFGEYLLPGWIPRFLSGLFAYNKYTGGGFWLSMMLPRPVALALGVAAVVTTYGACWRLRKVPSSSLGFAFAFCLVLNLTILVVPATTAAFNQVLLLPALLFVVYNWPILASKNRLSRFSRILLAAMAASPWLFAVLVVFTWRLSPKIFVYIWSVPVYLSLLLPFSTFGLLILFLSDVVEKSQTGLPRTAQRSSARP